MLRDLPEGQIEDAAAAAKRAVCMCVLRVGEGVALQLRDDDKNIPNPGRWGLFAGGVRPGEDMTEAMRREVYEELSIECEPRFLFAMAEDDNEFYGGPVVALVFEADVADVWKRHVLQEGQRAEVVPLAELRRRNPLAAHSAVALERYLESEV